MEGVAAPAGFTDRAAVAPGRVVFFATLFAAADGPGCLAGIGFAGASEVVGDGDDVGAAAANGLAAGGAAGAAAGSSASSSQPSSIAAVTLAVVELSEPSLLWSLRVAWVFAIFLLPVRAGDVPARVEIS
jgi:hypothetical protein